MFAHVVLERLCALITNLPRFNNSDTAAVLGPVRSSVLLHPMDNEVDTWLRDAKLVKVETAIVYFVGNFALPTSIALLHAKVTLHPFAKPEVVFDLPFEFVRFRKLCDVQFVVDLWLGRTNLSHPQIRVVGWLGDGLAGVG
jgi:hypothetical protein